jgi:alpha-tubulin suppressor-like RCC1 family protein
MMRLWETTAMVLTWLASAAAGDGVAPARASSLPCDARVVQLAAGKSHACALMGDGTVRCWGSNYRGQLGDGTTTFRSAPVAVSGLKNVAFIAAGERHTCAVLRDGSVSCWGANDHGQLGRAIADTGPIAAAGMSEDHSARPEAVAGVANIRALTAGETHVVALAKDGAVYFWGAADDVTERRVDVRKPFKVSIPSAKSIAAGFRRSCAATVKGGYCWGATLASVGQRTGPKHLAPVRAPELDAYPSFAMGLDSTCGLAKDGTVSCWGEHPVKGEPGAVSVASTWHTCEVLARGQRRYR